MPNMIEEIKNELTRNREILKEYEAIGPNRMFGAGFIREAIEAGEKAINEHDAVLMVRALAELRDTKG